MTPARQFDPRPEAPPDLRARKALDAWLHQRPALGWLLVAGAGYGKTCAARLIAARLGMPVRWIDRPTSRAIARQLGLAADAPSAELAEALCAQVLSEHPGGATVVFDAAEGLEGEFLTAWFRQARGLATLVTMRPEVPRSLARPIASGRIRLLDPADLALEPDEQAAWLAATPALSGLAERVGGWPLGVQALVGQGPRPGHVTLLQHLIEAELLDPLPADLLQQAVCYAPWPVLTIEGLSAAGATDPHGLLDRWHRWGLVGTCGSQWQWLPMVREALVERWQEALDPAERAGQLEAIGRFVAEGDPARAIRWYLEQDQLGAAVALLRRLHAEAHLQPEGYATLFACMDLLPDGVERAFPELLLVAGDRRRLEGALADAEALNREAERVLRARGENGLAFEALVANIRLVLLRNDLEAASELDRQAAALEPEAAAFQRYRYYNLQGCLYVELGKEPEAIDRYRRVLNHPHFDEPGFMILHLLAALNLGWLYYEQGKLQEAPRLFERVLEVSRRIPARPSAGHAARLYLALIACYQGDHAAARAHLGALGDEPLEDRIRQGGCLSLEGECHLMLGDELRAEQRFRAALSLFGALGLGEQADAGSVLKRLGTLARHRGELELAESLQRSALAQVEKLTRSKADVLLEWGLTRLSAGHAADAVKLFERSLEAIDSCLSRYREAKIRLALAVGLARSGHPEEAELQLATALDIVSEGPYPYALLIQPELSADLWQLLIRHGHDALRSRLEARYPREAERIRAQLATVLPALPPAAPTLIEVRTLGLLEVAAAGNPIDWPRKKAKALLAHLLFSKRGASRAELADRLFPELDEKPAHGRLDQLLHSLRKIFNPDAGPTRLTFREGRYELRREGLWIDFVTLEEAHARGSAALRRGETAEAVDAFEAGVELYRGPLFADRVDGFEVERHRYLRLTLEMLDTLCTHYLATDQAERARAGLERLLELDPLHEAAHRGLMTLYMRFERTDLARQQYRLCSRLLAQHLDAAPAPETRELARRLLVEL